MFNRDPLLYMNADVTPLFQKRQLFAAISVGYGTNHRKTFVNDALNMAIVLQICIVYESYDANLAKWATIKVSVMAFILQVKWNQCAKFRQAIISTEGHDNL